MDRRERASVRGGVGDEAFERDRRRLCGEVVALDGGGADVGDQGVQAVGLGPHPMFRIVHTFLTANNVRPTKHRPPARKICATQRCAASSAAMI